MIGDQARFNRAIAHFDALNAQDPNHETVDGKGYPKELLYAERMSAMLARYTANPSEALQLAARCQHIQRWKISRSSYAMTRAGYHQWRRALRDFHAETARAVLREAGYEDGMTARVCALLRKEGLLQADSEMQTLEDVVVLVFLESYLQQFVEEHSDYDEAKFLDILRKTLRKMSPQGRQYALTMISLPSELTPLLKKLAEEDNAI
ncbi:MAG TPA: DUF4202 domain-containing protein [Methylophilaceae bacterium]|nr:DUF4202 domain-containing protein [Methylophilaceae bacterium]